MAGWSPFAMQLAYAQESCERTSYNDRFSWVWFCREIIVIICFNYLCCKIVAQFSKLGEFSCSNFSNWIEHSNRCNSISLCPGTYRLSLFSLFCYNIASRLGSSYRLVLILMLNSHSLERSHCWSLASRHLKWRWLAYRSLSHWKTHLSQI